MMSQIEREQSAFSNVMNNISEINPKLIITRICAVYAIKLLGS